ncbi:MAG TPA: PadR family transcriptional regulator [Thermomicrobiales bacterium]|nr:PadR family transcriptional regulator [Thermomicrobiales bacterium]
MQSDEALAPLTPAVFHILLALAPGDKHGYEIMRQVGRDSQGRVRMGSGTLYGSIKRMLAARLIEEAGERPDPSLDDERRRYYRLTDPGRRALEAELRRYREVVVLADRRRLFPGPQPDAAR